MCEKKYWGNPIKIASFDNALLNFWCLGMRAQHTNNEINLTNQFYIVELSGF